MGPHGRGAAYGWRARRDLPRIVVDCASFTAATLGERTNEKRQSSGVLMSVDIDPDLDGVLGALQQGQADWVLLNYGAASKDTLRLKNYGCNGVEELKVSLVSISLSRRRRVHCSYNHADAASNDSDTITAKRSLASYASRPRPCFSMLFQRLLGIRFFFPKQWM